MYERYAPSENRPDTYQALGQTFGEVGSKYRRSSDREKYAKEMQKVSEQERVVKVTPAYLNKIIKEEYSNFKRNKRLVEARRRRRRLAEARRRRLNRR